MAAQKEKQVQEFDVKAAGKGDSDRLRAAAICADSVPAKSRISCRSHLT